MARIEIGFDNIAQTIILERIDNGYLLRTFQLREDGTVEQIQTAHVIPSGYQNNYKAHNEAIVDMLWELMDALEEYGSDYYDTAIEIKVKKQRKSV